MFHRAIALLILAAAAILATGCAAFPGVLTQERAKEHARDKRQLCRFELGSCHTYRPADDPAAEHNQAMGLAP
jgi:hypothetical protein